MNETILGNGAEESTHDFRDLRSEAFATVTLPPVTHEKQYDFHLNQRAIGICTAISVCAVMQKMHGIRFSPQYLYVNAKREIDGNMNEGSSLRTMLQYAYSKGVLPLIYNPYDDTHQKYSDYVNIGFTEDQKATASQYKLKYAKARLDPAGFATDLYNSKYGLLIRIANGENFYRPSWSKEDLSPLRKPNPITGGHAVLVKKYNGLDENQRNTMHNSWGGRDNPTTDNGLVWCDDGDIDYIYETQKDFITEAWLVSDYDAPVVFRHTFAKNIKMNDKGDEVVALQKVLVQMGYLAMPKGVAYGTYAELTRRAVLKFQKDRHVASDLELSHLNGTLVGPATRLRLNENQ